MLKTPIDTTRFTNMNGGDIHEYISLCPPHGSVALYRSHSPSAIVPLYHDFAAERQWTQGVGRQHFPGGML